MNADNLDKIPLTELEASLRVIEHNAMFQLNNGNVELSKKTYGYSAELKSYMRNRVEKLLDINLLY